MSCFKDYALSFIGTPFVHQGRAPGVGLDCGGVVECAAKMCGHEIASYERGYGRAPHKGMLEATLLRQPWLRQSDGFKDGNVLLMRFASHPQHLAVVDGDHIVHAYSKVGYVVREPLTKLWKRLTIYQFEVK